MMLHNPSYDYNMNGTGTWPAMPPLGLDGGAAYLPENGVRVPSDMIAIADANPVDPANGGDNDHDADDLTGGPNLLAELAARHNGGANIVFCDAHVEYHKLIAWLQRSESARQRWNNDHQPHQETWSNNP